MSRLRERSTEVFDLVGRWDETLSAAEDWDLADRTRAAGVEIAGLLLDLARRGQDLATDSVR
jgi:hypothetical protein